MVLFTLAKKLSCLNCLAYFAPPSVKKKKKKLLFDKKTFENQLESCLSSFGCFLSGRPFIAVPLCTEVRAIDVYGAYQHEYTFIKPNI